MTAGTLVISILATALLSACGVEGVRRLALRHDVLDVPKERSSHVHATPRGGGLAIVAAAALVWAAIAIGSAHARPWAFPLACLLIAGVSYLDDVRTLGTIPRFVCQGGAAVLVITGATRWSTIELPGTGAISLGAAGIVLAALWLVGMANFYNFLDGIDGIAASQAVVGGIAWLVIGQRLELAEIQMIGGLVASASFGFLVHNWPPARIFMGDVGAATLGFTFAALPIMVASNESVDPERRWRVPFGGVLILWPFVFDATITIVRRFRRRENIFAAHRTHIYQRLVISGWTHRRTTCLYAALAVVSASGGVAWIVGPTTGHGTSIVATVAVTAFVAVPCVLLAFARRAAALTL